jgi:cytochrome c-type biogenesis protein CcmH/NrfG
MSKQNIKLPPSKPATSWLESVLSGERYSKKQFSYFFFALSFLLYFNTISNDFSMDDSFVTRSHPFVTKGFDGIKDILTSPYLNDQKLKGEFRPVAQITFAIEYQFFGENPHINHFFNVLFYALICVLVFKLFTTIFDETYYKYILLGLLIFLVHPLHTEVVASIKNRENLLGTLFGLLACLQAIKHIKEEKVIHFIFSSFLLLIAIASKVDSVIFVFFIILIAYYYKKPKYIFIYFISFILVFGAFTLYKFSIFPRVPRNTEIHETPLLGEAKTLANTFKLSMLTLWYYVKLMIIPYPFRFYYGTGLINIPAWSNPIVWISFLIHIALLAFGVIGFIKRTFTGFAILWYLGGIFVFSQLVEPVIGIVAERHLFTSSIGGSMLLSFGIIKLYTYLKTKNTSYVTPLIVAISAVLIVFCILTLKRNKEWQNAVTLYHADEKYLQESIFFHVEMGNNYSRETGNDPNDPKYVANLNRSIKEYKIVLQKMPGNVPIMYNLGVSYLRVGKPFNANQVFKETYQKDSSYRAINHLLGLTYLFQKDTTQAVKYFKKELLIKPNNGTSVDFLYQIYSAQKNFKDGLQVFEPIVAKNIYNTRLLKAIANCYYFTGDIDKAMYYRKKIETHNFVENDDTLW